MNTGIRIGELKALRVQDLVESAQGGRLTISRTYCRHSHEIRNRTKGKRSRVIPLSTEMTTFLRKEAGGRAPDAPLVGSDRIEVKHQTKLNKRYWKALEKAKVRRVRIHDLRHTFAVHFLERGGQLFALKNLLGHHSIRQTECYLHFSSAMSDISRGLVDHHGSAPRLKVIEGGMQEAKSHKCPTEKGEGGEEGTKIRFADLD